MNYVTLRDWWKALLCLPFVMGVAWVGTTLFILVAKLFGADVEWWWYW